jgi:small nuclear ribonucleoprotein (snRNP)-like protein
MARRRNRRQSLACFVQALQGQQVVVELRQDTIVRGILLAADEQLNLQLSKAQYQPLIGEQRQAEYVCIRGQHVRFVHLPGNLDPATAIQQHRKHVAESLRQHSHQQAQAVQRGRPSKGAQLEFDKHET